MSTRPAHAAPGAVLRVRPTCQGLDPTQLIAGRDVVLALPAEHGTTLPEGVLIDDHLELAARLDVDRQAHAALGTWRHHVDEPLTIGPLSLSDIWHSELLAEVFVPACRIVAGLRAAATAYGAAAVECDGLDAALVDAVRAELAPLPVTAISLGPPPRYPSEEAVPPGIAARQPAWQRLIRRAVDAIGIPSFARGEVLVLPYLSTVSVLERLAAGRGPRPVVHLGAVPDRALTARAVRRGGWVGSPSLRARRRAARAARDRLSAAELVRWPEIKQPGLERLLHQRALACLAGRALETTAAVSVLRTPLAAGRIQAVLLPFDHEPQAKTIVRLAQRAGVPTLVVQHGYEPQRVLPTGSLSDSVGVWSEADRQGFPPEHRRRVRVTGNPRKAQLPAARRHRSTGRPVAVVLAEHHSRMSAILDRRITAVHLAIALGGLGSSRRTWRIIVRPHPSDDIGAFQRMVEGLASDAEVDGRTPAAELLANADLCVGALSTATLEAALLGARVVMLNPRGISWTPPLQEGGPVLMARTADELAAAVDAAMDAPEAPGADALREALGVDPEDPAGDLVDWLTEISRGATGR